ncbi:Endonuclease/exonuclease/phosphatase, partial [Dimargaris cristalligena]
AGTAIFSKVKPLSVSYGLKPTKLDEEGRAITLEFDDFFLVACYVPNAGDKLVRLDFRQEWDRAMNEYLTKLEETKPIVWTGDLNVAHQRWDLSRPDTNERSAGFTIEERNGFSAILNADPPRIDTFRHLYPEEKSAKSFTFFSYRFQCREKRLGWRLDYFVVSQQLLPQVVDVTVRSECYGASDHVPVVMWLKRPVTAPLESPDDSTSPQDSE